MLLVVCLNVAPHMNNTTQRQSEQHDVVMNGNHSYIHTTVPLTLEAYEAKPIHFISDTGEETLVEYV
jgi:hypothetical protein